MSEIMSAVKTLGRRDYCPCKSGKRLEGCCLKQGLFRPPTANVNPPGQRTNHVNPGCYLSAVDDNCSPDLSREHFISESILEILDIVGGSRGVLVQGFPWLTAPKALPPGAIASKVLCRRHNEALSPLDTCALRFFECLMALPRYLDNPGRKREQLFMFSGPDLERWMIKFLAGLLVSGNAMLDGRKILSAVPRGWLDVLMGRKVLPVGTGLGSMEVLGRQPQNVPTRIAFSPIFYSNKGVDEPAGAVAWLNALAFGLVLVNIPDRTGTWAEHFLPHASLTKFVGPKTNVTIFLAGEGWDTARGPTLAWSPATIGA